MAVFGIFIAPFAMTHQQSAYAANIFSGLVKLPSHNEMSRITLNESPMHRKNDQFENKLHTFGFAQFAYNNKLAKLSGYTPKTQLS